jgi:beta-carotene ketolase (CrtO type)
MPRTVLIIGAGHNGLVCGTLLARAGFSVTICEQNTAPGGCILTEELRPGFFINTGALELEGIVSSGLADDLQLDKHGLKWLHSSHLLSSWVGDEALYLSRSLEATLDLVGRTLGRAAAAEWKAFAAFSDQVMDQLGGLQHVRSAYAPTGKSDDHLLARLSDETLQTILSPAENVIAAHLENPLLRAAATAYATHPEMPPWAPGSGGLGCLLASSHGSLSSRPVGGSGKLIDALASAFRAHGGNLICGAGLRRLRLGDGRVQGAELSDGRELAADIVVSTIDIKRLAACSDEGSLPAIFNQAAARAHSGLFNVGEMKLDLALDAVVLPRGITPAQAGSLYYLQNHHGHFASAMREICAGRLPADIPMMAAIPSVLDPTLAPEGKSVIWLSAFVPARWADGSSWPGANEFVAEAMLESYERFAPGTRTHVIDRQITGPAEWERRTGNPAGNPNHLDMTIDQIFGLRPAAGLAHYRTPVGGLYLSGAGTPPGGGVHGVPGRLAAETILADFS